ncbi:MAG: thioredoxin fold domain-containing protein [Bacteroidota bacterium]
MRSWPFMVMLFVLVQCPAQQEVQWLTFAQLEDSLSVKPKKVLLNFYADWCAYCKKMEAVAFKDPKVVATLKAGYYTLSMDTETKDTITFGGTTFTNQQWGKRRNPTHDIPLLLASRDNQRFSVPALVILNEKFEVTARQFTYLNPKQLLDFLEN